MNNTFNWKAKWIWDGGGAKPRNYWACFRKDFIINNQTNEAVIRITGDSKYILYVNGNYIGAGPVRSWPFEQFYDTYHIDRHLKKGHNTIAVLVHHYGNSTFQYIQGRGGLFAQLEYSDGDIYKTVATDNTWKTHVHTGYKRDSVRISCQQAWAEIFDANMMAEQWKDPDFDDSTWSDAAELGGYGVQPWLNVIPRDIPQFREDILYPVRILTHKNIISTGQSITLDLQPNFFPGEYDSNPKVFMGFIASIINSPCSMKAKIRFPWGKWLSAYGDFHIDNRMYRIEQGQSEIEVEFKEGKNLFLMDVSGSAHSFFTYFNILSDEPVTFTAPFHNDFDFITIGPFDKNSILNIGEIRDDSIDFNNADYKNAGQVKCIDDLADFKKWIKPVNKEHMCSDNVYMDTIYREVISEFDTSYKIQNMIIPNEEYTEIKPMDKGDVEVVIDFGKEISGYIELDIEASQGNILDFYGIECIQPNGKVEHTDGVHCTMRYIAKDGRQCYRSAVRRGFRYLVVTFRNLTKPIKIYRIFSHLSTYPVVYAGDFKCPDWKLNRIWEIARHTTQLCMEDTFVDCPTYEQTFWVGDARNESLINYYTFGAYDIVKRCLTLVAKSMSRSHLPESQVPSGWQNVLTAWALFWMNACREYYEYTGDHEFLEDIYPYLYKAADAFADRINNQGLLELQAWNMLDWAPMETPDRGVVTHQNAELVKSLYDISAIADLMGKADDKIRLEGLAEGIKKAINEYLWNDEKQAYVDCIYEDGTISKTISMQTNVMVYLCDCAPEDRKEKIKQYLFDTPQDFIKIGSPFMSFFYFEALMKVEGTQTMLDNIRREWGGMIDNDATTCWETFPGFQKGRLARSHCHAWSAAPGYFLGAYVLGVRPLQPGFKRVLIDPKPCGLEWARGSVPVPGGRIDIRWENNGGSIKVWVKGPDYIQYEYGDKIKVELL